MNCGKWKVTSNPGFGYAVYRLKDVGEVDHSGNREYATGYLSDRAEAEKIAARLNEPITMNKEETT